MSAAKKVTSSRLANASSFEVTKIDRDLISEMEDVGVLLDILGISYSDQRATKAPSERDILKAQERMMEIYEEVRNDAESLDKYRDELSNMLSWFGSRKSSKESERKIRATRHAEKYGNGNETAHYLIQIIEELGEVLVERDRLSGVNQATDVKELEVQKRALKVLRFGEDTINKGDGIYKGKTNKEAFEQVIGSRVLSNATDAHDSKEIHEKALRHASEAFVNYNFMAGRMYSYANASGLLWFWAYKIRAIKEAHRMIRDNPLKALTTAIALPEMMDDAGIPTGSPVGDNAITAILQDRAKYSIGPGILESALSRGVKIELYKSYTVENCHQHTDIKYEYRLPGV